MTIIKLEPRKEIVIHEYTAYKDANELINTEIGEHQSGATFTGLKWVDGILLKFTPLPMNEITTKEVIEGRVHWDHMSFAPSANFQERISTGRGPTVTVTDVSKNPSYVDVAKFIKENLLREKE
jgi:hypothetical protein